MTTRSRSTAASSPTTADEYADEQAREWGTYTALVAIDFYGTRAFNVGDPVPVSAVEGDTGWVPAEFVDKRADAFAGSATVVPAEQPAVDPAASAAPPASTPDTITTTEG